MKKGALLNCVKFTGKTPVPDSLFLNKFAGLRAATLLKKKPWHICFPVNFEKFLRTPYLQNTSVRLLLILFVACFLYFPLPKIFATKKVASCEKHRLVENQLNVLCISKSYIEIKIKINLNSYFQFFMVPQKVLWRP